MKFLLAAVNAKYIHSNPAVYSLAAYAGRSLRRPESGGTAAKPPAAGGRFSVPETPRPGDGRFAQGMRLSETRYPVIEIAEYTVNNQMDLILQDIYRKKPDFVGFSCYIWNIGYVLELARDLGRVLPETEIWLGGPEVSFDAASLLEREPAVRGIMRGEGEATFAELVKVYGSGGAGPGRFHPGLALEGVRGITFRGPDGRIVENAPRPLLSMDDLPFYYEGLEDFENRIIYYESSRGCPFSCSYCLSSIDKTVRFRDVDTVKRELDFFLARNVSQVKFVDRTFNCRKSHTMAIWRHLAAHDNGVTNFHFEVSADLFDEEELELIQSMRPGLIQLEIGVQSTNKETIAEIRRNMDLARLKAAVERVRGFHNTHQHLDLIAGLPYEGVESFQKSFDDVYAMRPNQLQLGFLKVLKGSRMERMAGRYGLVYRGTPPYEVLCTAWMDFDGIIRLKGVEEMVEVYYNSGQFTETLPFMEKKFPSPFGMFEALAQYYEEKRLFGVSHGRAARYEILYRFFAEKVLGAADVADVADTAGRRGSGLSELRDVMMLDLYLRENIKSRPSFASDQAPYRYAIREFFRSEAKRGGWLCGYEGYDSRQMAKMAHMEAMEDGTFILFDYKNRDPLDHNARALRFLYGGEDVGKAGDEKREGRKNREDSRCAGPGIWRRIPLLSKS